MSVGKKCEICMEQPAVVLCSECHKCCCEKCNNFIHNLQKFKGHKIEAIAEGIIVNAMCPFHDDTPLKLFCVDEVKLCCTMCERENLRKEHKIVEITKIQEDNKIFSAHKTRVLFEDSMKHTSDLNKKIGGVIEKIGNDVKDIQGKVKQFFEEEHKKLEEEEKKVLNELEDIKNKNVASLEKHLDTLNKVIEYSNLLSKVGTNAKGNCSRLMELNIVSEMEKQRKELELLCGEEMYDLHATWDDKERKLSFAENLFNGAPVPNNITFQKILYKEMEIAWECDVNRIHVDDRDKINYVVEMAKNDVEKWKEIYSGKEMKCTVKELEMGSEYTIRVKCVVDGSMGRWSEKRDVKIPFFSDCVWKECPDSVDDKRKYSVDENNHRIATMKGNAVQVDGKWVNLCTIIGSTLVPPNKVTSWNIKIQKSEYNNGGGIYVGVAPFDINQNEWDNYNKCGWYFNCYASALWSGPPHNYRCNYYGPGKEEKKEAGMYFHTGDSVGVVMDTLKGELSFILNKINYGVAYEGIPLDKPLVPCVLTSHVCDSVELII